MQKMFAVKGSKVGRRVWGKKGRLQGHNFEWKTNTPYLLRTLRFTPGTNEPILPPKVKIFVRWGNVTEKSKKKKILLI